MAPTGAAGTARLCVGVIAGRHGVRGAVKIKPFTDRADGIADLPGLEDDAGRPVAITVQEVRKTVLIARVDGIDDANAAEAATGTQLFVARDALPALESDEYYHADLIGLRVARTDGREIGTVAAVYDFGAGDLIDVRLDGGGTAVLPFRAETVPAVDIAGGRITVDPPPGLIEETEDEP